MIETIVYEPHTRILLFLVFEANSNKTLIRWILNEACKVYGKSKVTDLDSDVKFINKLQQTILSRSLLRSGDARKNQDEQALCVSVTLTQRALPMDATEPRI
jgi:hypothetical protein